MLQFGWEGFSRKGEINNVAEKEKKGSKNSFFFLQKGKWCGWAKMGAVTSLL